MFRTVKSLAALALTAVQAFADEPAGPAAAAVAAWFRTSTVVECVSPDGKGRRCTPDASTTWDIRVSPDGHQAVAWATYTTDPTGNATATAAAVFRREGETWRLNRELPGADRSPAGEVKWQGELLHYTVAVLKPGDARCCATGREARVIAPAAEEPPGAPWMHNGSTMALDPEVGTIVYSKPRAGLSNVVRPGAVLFRGRLGFSGRDASGTAYAFKDGCDPAPYAVRGGYSRDNETLTLTGAGPVRQGCAVVGYSTASPHAKLVFKNVIQD